MPVRKKYFISHKRLHDDRVLIVGSRVQLNFLHITIEHVGGDKIFTRQVTSRVCFREHFFFSSCSTSKGRNEFGKNEASSLDGSLTQYVPFDVLVFFPFRIRTFRVSRLLNLFSSFEKKQRRRSPIFSLSRSVEARLPITDQSKVAQLTMLRNSGTPQRWWELLIKQRDNCKLMTKASDFEHLYWPLQLPPTHYRRRQPRHEAQLFYFWQRDRVPLPSRLILVHRMKWQRHEN